MVGRAFLLLSLLMLGFIPIQFDRTSRPAGAADEQTKTIDVAAVDSVPSEPAFQSNSAKGRKEPDVVVFGVGDSGTRGINHFLHEAGNVHMCDGNRHRHTEDCNPTKACHPPNSADAMEMLRTDDDAPPQLSEMHATHPKQFQKVVQCERESSQTVFAGIDSSGAGEGESVFWGYKNPRHSYILPVLIEAFGNHTAYIFVARHPYDICSGKNQNQFRAFGHIFASGNSCMNFWFEAMSQLLTLIEEHSESARIVRTESLVLGGISQRDATSKCIASVVGYKYDEKAARASTSIMIQHNSSYGGQSRVEDNGKANRLWKKAVSETAEAHHALASKLGYNLTAYGLQEERDAFFLTEATSKVVC
ncbi:hypothetical protein ACHAXT_011860 [Thalassiosira profunda]